MGRDKKDKQTERLKNLRYRQMLRTFDDPALYQVCEEVKNDDPLYFLTSMRKVCLATSSGVGLAAPQIGIIKRAVFIAPERDRGRQWFMINPVIQSKSQETDDSIEGCLSYPEISGVVTRFSWVTVNYIYIDTTLKIRESRVATFRDWEARIIQHEVDHLQGECAIRAHWKQKAK